VRVIWLLLMIACEPPIPPMTPTTASIGCLEIAVTQVDGGRRVVLEWRLTNLCDHAVPVDLAQARVVAIGPSFGRTMLAPRDAYHVFAPGWLDVGVTTFVRIAYTPELVSRDATIEVELDAFNEVSHRHVILAVAPPTSLRPSTSASPHDQDASGADR
jgi:hypothetical protein